MEKLLNFIFQPSCLFCNKGRSAFCSACLEKCRILEYDYCLLCDQFSYFGETHAACASDLTPSSVFSAYLYEGIPRLCVKRSKFNAKEFAVLKILSTFAVEHALKCGKRYDDYVVVAVPVSKEKMKVRGFNQAELIAKIFAKKYNLPYENSILTRIKDTKAQFGSVRQARFDNIKGAFVVNTAKVDKNAKYLLVDDICTTGATLLEATKALKNAGALDVKCFTLCKTQKIYV